MFANYKAKLILIIGLILSVGPPAFSADDPLADLKPEIRQKVEVAINAASECGFALSNAIATKALKKEAVFDRLYIPIPKTRPLKFNTQYDSYTDVYISPLQERVLKKNPDLIFAIMVDRNGYCPTHNKRFSQELTGDSEFDLLNNRTKRIFNDRTGFLAARNTRSYLISEYRRDTGERLIDISAPITIAGEHWGAFRISFEPTSEMLDSNGVFNPYQEAK